MESTGELGKIQVRSAQLSIYISFGVLEVQTVTPDADTVIAGSREIPFLTNNFLASDETNILFAFLLQLPFIAVYH